VKETSRAAVPIWRPGEPVAPLAAVIARGGVLAIPTESSYGLAVDPWNPEGVARIYRIKEREAGKPLPVVASDVGQLAGLGIDLEAPILSPILGVLARLWPAPLTAVLPVARPLPASAGAPSLAVRVPAHEGLRWLLAALGTPLTATSANPSGGAPIVDPAELVVLGNGGVELLLVDGGVLPGGPPSTLVAFAADGAVEVLRPGPFDAGRL
jgi:L-threonylcarbamoyladenylate synthase